MLKSIKSKISLIAVAMMLLLLVGCGNENEEVVLCDVNLGVCEYQNIDILGVTYKFFSNGYASVEKIKNSSAVIEENVEYQGKKYKVIAIGHIFFARRKDGSNKSSIRSF